MPNDPNEKSPIPQNKPTIHATQLPIDLASKVIVKPANDMKQPPFRTIQQAPQMRVVRMPTPGTQIIQTQIMPQTILKTSMQQQTGRSTITVSKSPATYLPRVTATLSTIQQKGGQQIRTPTPPVSGTAISPAFVRQITPRTSSPTAAVLSQQGGTTAWVSGTGAMQVQVPTQIIRSTITQNTRTQILQNVQPNAITVTNNSGNAQTITNIFGQQSAQQQQNIGGSTTISVPATTGGAGGTQQQQQQPTYVATVLPQRPQAATIVYTSQQQQPFTAIQGQVQRMGIANASNTRQVRPIQRIPTAGIRVNTSSLSIRPNVPGLTPTTVLTTQNRNASGLVATSTTLSNTIPARIFQVQTSQSTSGTQQVIGQPNQKILQANVMTLPIIVNNNRIATHTIKTPLQQPNIIAHVSKLTSGDGAIISNSITTTIPSSTMVASIQGNQSNQAQTNQLQVSQGSQQQGTSFTTQTAQVTNLATQIMGNQTNLHQQGSNVSTVVPLQIAPRSAIKTITVSTPNSGGLDATNIHRSLSTNTGSLQTTTIMPIAKLVSQQQQQNITSAQSGNQSAPVFIHTRIPASTIAATNPSQVVSVSTTPSSSTPTVFSSAGSTTVFYEQASVSIAPSSLAQTADTKTTSSSSSNNESSSFTVVSATPNVRYSEKMIQSIIASSLQSNSGNSGSQGAGATIQPQQQQQHATVPTVRYSPLVVESQSGTVQSGQQQQPQHQIITMTAGGNIIQQASSSQAQVQNSAVDSVITALPASPRSIGAVRNKNETTPIKMSKKATKIASVKQEHLQQQQQQQPPQQQQQQQLKPIPMATTSTSPKGMVVEESPLQGHDDWSDDGSTTVSIPNSPSPEEDDLDAMIMSNQFNKNLEEEFSKYASKCASKMGSSIKRESSDHQLTPRKKLKTANERLLLTDVVDKGSAAVETNENSENVTKKREIVLKKPQASLLSAYNQTWKPAPNHFMRYSDVRVREDRRPNVMDIANQPKFSQRINGWKTFLISAEIEEVINDETREMEILTSVLKRLEASESGAEVEKINELIKGNMQRCRLIIDSFTDSKTQLMKIFEHKEHAASIINRCASKRNFKKR